MLRKAADMRKALLSGEVMDVLYYTHMLARNTLMASGDLTLEEYLMLLDAAFEHVATPKELARALSVEPAQLLAAADECRAQGLLVRTRSPLDRRLPGFTATASGRRKAVLLNRLLVTVASDFWRTDQEGVIELVKTIEPFQRTGPAAWPVGDEAPITLRSLCALLGLWQAYRDFGARFWLSFSELHMLIITHEFGPQPNHPLYRDRNMFATNDYAANVMMARDKGLMIEKDGTFALSPAGRQKIELIFDACEPLTQHRSPKADGPLADLQALCRRMTAHAMENAMDLYRSAPSPGR